MNPILFVDYHTPAPYDSETLMTQAMGGTEGTVVRVASGLGLKTSVVVAQPGRKDVVRCKEVTYMPLLTEHFKRAWQAVIVLRDPNVALDLRARMQGVPIWIWNHDLPSLRELQYIKALAENDIGLIVVSDFHKREFLEFYKKDPFLPKGPNIQRIYNPIDEELEPDETAVDPHKLVFLSSPHKGLAYTLQVFEKLRRQHPEWTLVVSNPGYHKSMPSLKIPRVIYLGHLTHANVIKEMRSAFCMLNLNHVCPETFGLVYAEANAVGTPVLTHDFGAAPEVLSDRSQLINTHDLQQITDRLLQWHEGGRPLVRGKSEFRLSRVIESWEEVLT